MREDRDDGAEDLVPEFGRPPSGAAA